MTAFTESDLIYWWRPTNATNFGDELAYVIVERIINKPVKRGSESSKYSMLFSVGSVLHIARNGDVIWGSGYRHDPFRGNQTLQSLDVRAVRGPRSRELLLEMGIECPEIYGDPALLLPYLFPEFQVGEPSHEYIIIPHFTEVEYFKGYRNVVSPMDSWDKVVRQILKSKLVVSGSLHGIIIAEAFGIPARLVKMTWHEELLKYQDYYEATGRPDFTYATSVYEALQMGGEKPIQFDPVPLLNAFPYDYFRGI